MTMVPNNQDNCTHVREVTLQPAAARIVEAGVLLLICLLTVLGNTLLWVTVLRYKEFHKCMYILLLSLSASDVIVGVFNMPLMIYTAFVGRRDYGCNVCRADGYVFPVCICSTINSVCAVSVNRYIRVCRERWYPKIYSLHSVIIHVALPWLMAFFAGVPLLLDFEKIRYEPALYLCRWDNFERRLYMIPVGSYILFTTLLIAYCNLSIYLKSRKSTQAMRRYETAHRKITISIVGKAGDSCEARTEKDGIQQTKGIAPEPGAQMTFPTVNIQEVASKATKIMQDEDFRERSSTSISRGSSPTSTPPEEMCERACPQIVTSLTGEGTGLDPLTPLSDQPTPPQQCNAQRRRLHVQDVRQYTPDETPHQPDDSNPRARSTDVDEMRTGETHSCLDQAPAGERLFNVDQKPTGERLHSVDLVRESPPTQPAMDVHFTPPMSGSLDRADSPTELATEPRRREDQKSFKSTTSSVVSGKSGKLFLVGIGPVKHPSLDEEVLPSQARASSLMAKHKRDDMHVTMTVTVVVALFLITYYPGLIIMVIESTTSVSFPPTLKTFMIFLVYFNSMCNPIIYGWGNLNIRNGYKRQFTWWICRTRQTLDQPKAPT